MLIDANAEINVKNKDGWNAFHFACSEGNEDIARIIYQVDNSCWKSSSKNGLTPFHSGNFSFNFFFFKKEKK